MPILQRETSLFPENLFKENVQEELQNAGAQWWAIYTMSRREKEFMRRLEPYNVPFYCPIMPKTTRTNQGRKRTTHLPLFANYVFICANEEQRAKAFTTNCVSRCLDVVDQQQLLADLQRIEWLIQSEEPITPESKLVPGDPVRIKSGPFTGLEGVVFQRSNRLRLFVSVNFLQSGASLQVNDWELERRT